MAYRRLAAFAIDYLILALYIGLLTLAALAIEPSPAGPSSFADKVRGHLFAFAVLTLPVVAYFALGDWLGGTVGKRALSLMVTAADGAPLPLSAAWVRTFVKLAPWELAHAAIWYVPGRPFIDPPGLINMAGWVLALVTTVAWAATLFTGSGRTPYDRIARTMVLGRAG